MLAACLFVALWTVLAVLGAIQSYVAQLVFDKPVLWGLAFRRSFEEWYAYGFVSLGIWWLCGRLHLEPGRTPSWVVKHLAAAIVFSIGYVAILSALLAGEVSVQSGQILTFGYLFRKMAIHYVLLNLMMYWIVVFAHLGWDYFRRYRVRELQAAQLQRELVEARLAALRMQLNPHFLFNTLHAISALIHESPEAADRMLARLSDLLRLTLDQSKPQEVSLREEMAFLGRYLEIEKTRFADRLSVETRLAPGVEDALVPYLILQPLVENAIRHGIEPRETGGRLVISAEATGGRLELRVSDNGPGRDEKKAPPSGGIGLSNTRSRLQHLYGSNYELELAAGESGGMEARIAIPFREASGLK